MPDPRRPGGHRWAWAIVLWAGAAAASPPPASLPVAVQGYALFRLDPLGIEPRIVEQLEHLLRVELERIIGPLPPRAAIERVEAASPKLQGCTADPACLAPLARALKATRVVAGNVGGLAGSYVINLKLVDGEGRELRRVTATLRGSPEELIAEVRVAAYRLVAPERLVGAIALLSDVPDAAVRLDGSELGRTPLGTAIERLPIGVHRLEVARAGFSSFAEEVPVRFEKTTQVVVHQIALGGRDQRRSGPPKPLRSRWYFWAAVAGTALAAGVLAGFLIPRQQAVDCRAMPERCP